jgi:hypothetical protein
MFCVLLVLVLPGYALAQTAARPPVMRQNLSRPVSLPAPKAQEQFVVYWTTEAGWNTELLLRNNLEGSDLTVTPSLRMPDGSESALPAVTIAAGDVITVDLRETLSRTAPKLIGAWGSLVVRYRSTVNGGLYSSVMVRAAGRPIAFHLDGFGRGSTFETGSREGIWWLPRPEITDYLILTNSGERLLEPRLVLYEANGKTWQQNLKLLAHQSQRLSVRALLRQSGLQGSYGGFKIDIAQGARFLDSAHVLFEQSGGFSAVMKMFRSDPRTTLASRNFGDKGDTKEWTTRAPMLALSTPDPALGLPADTILQPTLFIRNTLAKTVTAVVRFNWRSTATTGKSAPITLILKPNETRLLDVGALQDGKSLPSDANWASVILSAPVLPDELLAVAASYDQTGRYGAQTPFSDQLAPHWEGGKWEVDDTHNSLSMIINGGSMSVVAELTIFYNQGKGQYQMQRLLAPEEQMFVDFGQVIHDHIPDKNGQILPHDLTFGAYRVRDLTDSTTANLYEGKVIVDKTFGHVSYGCMICCGPDTPFMMYDPLTVSLGGSANQGVQAMNSCTGKISTITGDFPTWWTDNTSIATASGSSITGVAVGTTNNNAQSVMMYFGPKEDSGGGPCPEDQEQSSGGTNVPPTITGPNTVWWFGGQSPSGYTTQITLTSSGGAGTTWQVTAGSSEVNLSSSSGASINITSTGTAFSTSVGDVQITATANSLSSNPFSLTTRTPTLLQTPAITNTTSCDSSHGYVTTIVYNVLDNLSQPLPTSVLYNEKFTTSWNVDFSGTNWPQVFGNPPTPSGGDTGTTTPGNPASLADFISGPNLSLNPNPVPTCSGGGSLIININQEWRIGTDASGVGRRVAQDNFERFLDHADHNPINTPDP